MQGPAPRKGGKPEGAALIPGDRERRGLEDTAARKGGAYRMPGRKVRGLSGLGVWGGEGTGRGTACRTGWALPRSLKYT